MTDAYPTLPISRRRRRAAAALTAAAVAGTVIAPGLATGPATAAEDAARRTEPARALAGPGCEEALPYGASASADLLRLTGLDLPSLGLTPGPVVDARIASTGAGMAADAEVAAAAAARDVAANLLGLDLVGLLPVGELGHRVYQQAPPDHADPATHTGATLDLGVLRARLGDTSAHATWDEPMRCAARTGPAAESSASLLDAEVLPAVGGRALVALPGNLSSSSGSGLVTHAGAAAARATASASVTELRLFAGSDAEIVVRVLSEPTLEATATGEADTSSVRYHAPVLEISGPGVGTRRLESPGAHVDLTFPAPVGDLTGSLPAGLGLLTAGPDRPGSPLELAGAPDLAGLTRSVGPGRLPVLGDVIGDLGAPAGAGGLSVLRLSLGELRQEITDESVTASAASLRLQLLGWDGTERSRRAPASSVLDLGVGLLEVGAAAPPPPEPGPPDDHCGDCPGDSNGGGGGGGLPVTGPAAGLIAGAGVLLAVAGRLLMLAGNRGRRGRRRLAG